MAVATHSDTFDEHLGAFKAQTGDVRDPYPDFALAREHAPVVENDPVPQGDGDRPGLDRQTFSVFRYDDVNSILREAPDPWSSTAHVETMGHLFGRSILQLDGEEHARTRGLINHAFRPKVIKAWRDDVVVPLAHELIDEFAADGEADLVRQFTFELPVRVIAHILGVPDEDVPQFHQWALTISNAAAGWDNSVAAREAVEAYFEPLIHERRQNPGLDLVSQLASAEMDGHSLSDDEIFPFINLLTSAGAETTFCSTGNLLFGLLTHQEQFGALLEDRSLLPQAIEEGLRWEAAVMLIPRLAMRDVEVAGTTIPEGAVALCMLGSANRDERRWDEPDQFDIFREHKHHIAFAAGPHACIGMHLARLEMEAALNVLFDRTPNMRIHPDAEDVHVHGMVFRTPFELPVVFDAN